MEDMKFDLMRNIRIAICELIAPGVVGPSGGNGLLMDAPITDCIRGEIFDQADRYGVELVRMNWININGIQTGL